MAVYKEEKTGTWRAVYRYTDWNGERKQTQKRGFKTKREAQAWEREQIHKTSADLDMNFKSFVEPLHSGYEDPAQGKHLGHKGAYYPHQAAPILRQAEDVQHHCSANHHLAERDAEP